MQTFDEQLENWLEETEAQLRCTKDTPEQLRLTWGEVQARAEEILEWSREEDWEPEDEDFFAEYSEFLRQAEQFSQQLADQSDPFAWILEPLHLVEAYVAGEELSPQAARLIQEAYERVYDDQQSSELEGSLRKLMVWAQGHRQMSVLELRDEVQATKLLLSSLEEFQDDTPFSVLEVLTALHLEPENESILDTLDLSLGRWEGELSSLLSVLGDDSVDLSEELNSLLDRCSETLEKLETDPMSIAPQEFEKLCKEWQSESPKFELFAEMAARKVSSATPYLDALQQKTFDFQNQKISVGLWQKEIRQHMGRWDEVKGELRQAVLTEGGDPKHLDSVEDSLQILVAIERPDDPRIDSSVSTYIHSLTSLKNG